VSRYIAHGPVRLAALNERFRQAARRWPGLSDVLHDRLGRQTHRASMHLAMLHLPRVEKRRACAGHPLDVASESWSIPALADEVSGIRQQAWQFACGHGVPDDRLADLRLAISDSRQQRRPHAFRTRDYPGTVTLGIHIEPEHFADVVVRDDGIGMSPRSDSPGLGLGLSLIERVADETERRRPDDAVSLRPGLRSLPAVPVGTRQSERAMRGRHPDWASESVPWIRRRV
jgi:anti-sigma regulatory factor (Ser/Thr protein kinase)